MSHRHLLLIGLGQNLLQRLHARLLGCMRLHDEFRSAAVLKAYGKPVLPLTVTFVSVTEDRLSTAEPIQNLRMRLDPKWSRDCSSEASGGGYEFEAE
jgi:hypothetical protein